MAFKMLKKKTTENSCEEKGNLKFHGPCNLHLILFLGQSQCYWGSVLCQELRSASPCKRGSKSHDPSPSGEKGNPLRSQHFFWPWWRGVVPCRILQIFEQLSKPGFGPIRPMPRRRKGGLATVGTPVLQCASIIFCFGRHDLCQNRHLLGRRCRAIAGGASMQDLRTDKLLEESIKSKIIKWKIDAVKAATFLSFSTGDFLLSGTGTTWTGNRGESRPSLHVVHNATHWKIMQGPHRAIWQRHHSAVCQEDDRCWEMSEMGSHGFPDGCILQLYFNHTSDCICLLWNALNCFGAP